MVCDKKHFISGFRIVKYGWNIGCYRGNSWSWFLCWAGGFFQRIPVAHISIIFSCFPFLHPVFHWRESKFWWNRSVSYSVMLILWIGSFLGGSKLVFPTLSAIPGQCCLKIISYEHHIYFQSQNIFISMMYVRKYSHIYQVHSKWKIMQL